MGWSCFEMTQDEVEGIGIHRVAVMGQLVGVLEHVDCTITSASETPCFAETNTCRGRGFLWALMFTGA